MAFLSFIVLCPPSRKPSLFIFASGALSCPIGCERGSLASPAPFLEAIAMTVAPNPLPGNTRLQTQGHPHPSLAPVRGNAATLFLPKGFEPPRYWLLCAADQVAGEGCCVVSDGRAGGTLRGSGNRLDRGSGE